MTAKKTTYRRQVNHPDQTIARQHELDLNCIGERLWSFHCASHPTPHPLSQLLKDTGHGSVQQNIWF